MGVSEVPRLKPSETNPSRMRWVLLQSCRRRSGSLSMISKAASTAAALAGLMLALKMCARELCLRKSMVAASAAMNPPTLARDFAEGAHDQIHLIGQPEMAGRAGAAFAQNSDRMRVIHHHRRPVLFGQPAQLRQPNDVAFHAENTVHHDELAGFGIDFLQPLLQRLHVVMGKPQ